MNRIGIAKEVFLKETILDLYVALNGDVNNVYIGGSYALFLHDVILHKAPEDIDIIIHIPTSEQLKKIELLSTIKSTDCYNREQSIKIKKETHTINIIINDKPNLHTTLCYKCGEYMFLVKGVESVMEARRAYGNRKKDLVSSLKLKELNFNTCVDEKDIRTDNK